MESVISNLDFQLNGILSFIKTDLKNETTTYNYFFNEDKTPFLSKNLIIDFLSEKRIENIAFLSTINEKCIQIIKYWKFQLSKFPKSAYSIKTDGKEFYYFSNPNTGGFINHPLKFNCVVLSPRKWEKYNTETGKDFFFENYNSEPYTIQEIVKACKEIMDIIILFFPQSKPIFGIDSTPEKFVDFASQFSNQYLKANYKNVVREFSIKENAELKRKVKCPIVVKNSVIVSFFTLDQYKEMAKQAINEPLANKEGVIKTLLDNYIERPLKRTIGKVSKIYDNIRNQTNHSITGNEFLYYSNLIAIEELIKFEMYLLNGCKEEQENKETTLKDFFLTTEQKTVDAIQQEFKDYEGKRLAMVLHKLTDEKMITIFPNSKTKGRKHFVMLLKDKKYNLSYVNRILSDSNELKTHKTDDPDYIDIETKLFNIILKKVV
ncbi:MAG: hypothetical protein WBA61_03815 [Aequorivita sp.]